MMSRQLPCFSYFPRIPGAHNALWRGRTTYQKYYYKYLEKYICAKYLIEKSLLNLTVIREIFLLNKISLQLYI